jgi:hypothetical protein
MKFQPTKKIEHVINENGCYVCISHIGGYSGYPEFKAPGAKRQGMHRYIYKLYKGEIPDGFIVRHTCDNRKCINPNHLILGTKGDNNRDTRERGRTNFSKGKDHYLYKITDDQFKEIYFSTEKRSIVAKKYNICENYVSIIRSGRIRKDFISIINQSL